jgi:S-DNA-T family DNA segregation ATPase FtsK/SpoIIIE
MRITRTNFPPASFGDTQQTEPQEQQAESVGLRRLRAASERAAEAGKGNFDSHFFLAPNVRFTRTPERELNGLRTEASEAQPGDTTPMDLANANLNVEQLREVLSTMMILQGGNAMGTANVSEPAVQPLNDNVGIRPAVEDRTAPAAPVSPFAHLSDFAFWETMEATLDAERQAPVPMLTAPVAKPAVAEPVRPSVVSLYKAIDIKAQSVQPILPVPVNLPVPLSTAALPTAPVLPTRSTAAVPAPVALPAKSVFPWSRGAAPKKPQTAVIVAPLAVAPLAVAPLAVAPLAVAPPAKPVPDELTEAPALPVAVQQPKAPVTPEPTSVAISKPFKIDPVVKTRTLAGEYEFPARSLLQDPPETVGFVMTQEQLERNAGLLESVLEDFGIRGEIIHVRPGPVVTLYEFEPAPGVKSSRVIGLADDIARSMSALSARVAVVPGRNVIGIELPNATRETVYFGELIDSPDFSRTGYKLALCLGKTIGGEPVIAELAKMPHLLVAGTTGSGKSVAINTMILSLLYRLTPEECRLIMVDPKMLELSVYDGIPHLLTPVVTDPKKAVLALKWAVREMEDRYRKMSRLGVRNIDGYNARAAEARARGEVVTQIVQTGFDKGTGEPINEAQEIDLSPMPYIVVIVDEMADLMMVAGKEIEGAIQRLAQMARAAGIHLIMATQRPSVDVITGTIKANFPTRISFQVTSKIDSRTILGEQGAEQLLGQGDMLHMAGGGRIVRVHGPFVSDQEVEKVVAHLKTQGRPEYLDTVTVDEDDDEAEEADTAVFDKSDIAAEDGNDLYDKAVKVIQRDKKCSTSYIQRRLGIGYNRAASLVERMEKEGLVGPANHVGKREILGGSHDREPANAGFGGEE